MKRLCGVCFPASAETIAWKNNVETVLLWIRKQNNGVEVLVFVVV
jgi:hypothetical protein